MPKEQRTKEEIIARMNEIGVSKRVCLGSCPMKRAEDGSIGKEARKVSFILVSEENAGERFDWWEGEVYIEELDVQGANYQGLRTFFKDHRPSVDNAIGRVENTRIDGSTLKADVIFGSDRRSKEVFQKYVDGILTDVSIGYRINDVVITKKDGDPDHVLVTDFEIVELSAVWKGFDAGAGVGRSSATEPVVEMDKRDITVMERQLKLKEKMS